RLVRRRGFRAERPLFLEALNKRRSLAWRKPLRLFRTVVQKTEDEEPHDDGRDAFEQKERSEEHTSESSHLVISYAVFCLKKKNQKNNYHRREWRRWGIRRWRWTGRKHGSKYHA